MPLSNLAVWLWIEIQGKIATRTLLELDGLDDFLAWLEGAPVREAQAAVRARIAPPRVALLRYLTSRPEPVGRWIRKARGRSFP